jgi:hypothetical protein
LVKYVLPTFHEAVDSITSRPAAMIASSGGISVPYISRIDAAWPEEHLPEGLKGLVLSTTLESAMGFGTERKGEERVTTSVALAKGVGRPIDIFSSQLRIWTSPITQN